MLAHSTIPTGLMSSRWDSASKRLPVCCGLASLSSPVTSSSENWGRLSALAAMFLGAALSYIVAPNLAFASGAAFLLSETADFAVYTPIIRRGYMSLAILASGTVGVVVDTVLFLFLAFGSLAFWEGQVIGKMEITVAAAALVWLFRRGRRDAASVRVAAS